MKRGLAAPGDGGGDASPPQGGREDRPFTAVGPTLFSFRSCGRP